MLYSFGALQQHNYKTDRNRLHELSRIQAPLCRRVQALEVKVPTLVIMRSCSLETEIWARSQCKHWSCNSTDPHSNMHRPREGPSWQSDSPGLLEYERMNRRLQALDVCAHWRQRTQTSQRAKVILSYPFGPLQFASSSSVFRYLCQVF